MTEPMFTQAMNAVLPGCLRIRACRAVEDDFPALMSLVAGADYRITFSKEGEGERAAARFEAFMALDHYVASRRTKSGEHPCDIRPFVLSGNLRETQDGYIISLRTLATQAGMLKPALWLDSLREFAGCGSFSHRIYRERILARTADGQLIPMEEV